MQIVVEKNSYNKQYVDVVDKSMRLLIEKVADESCLETLDYFVIADADDENFATTIMKYASLIGCEASIDKNEQYSGAGKALSGVDDEGMLRQVIVVKSSLWMCAVKGYTYIKKKKQNRFKQKKIIELLSLSAILHELWHAIDTVNQYNMFGDAHGKISYDLSNECEEYIRDFSLSIWGEYFAESFAYQNFQFEEGLSLEREKDMIKCVDSYSLGNNTTAILERVYRILYFFVLRIAFVHQNSNFGDYYDYNALNKNEITATYIPILKRTELAIIDLHRNYPHWDTSCQMNELMYIIKDFFNFEVKMQSEN